MNLPEMLRTAKFLGTEYNFLIPVAATVSKSLILDFMNQTDCTELSIYLVPDALPALAHSRAGIIASGTATVEAALMELPFVMVYRVTPLTYLLGRSTVKVPNFAMVNLIAGEEIVPELVQRNFRAENVIRELNKIIGEAPPREKMIRGLQRVRQQLLSGGQASSLHPAERAAQAIQQLYTNRGLSQNG